MEGKSKIYPNLTILPASLQRKFYHFQPEPYIFISSYSIAE
jgi:hypothetical protein